MLISRLALFLILGQAEQPQADADPSAPLREELVRRIEQIDVSELSVGDSVSFHLSASEALQQAGQEQQAAEFFGRARELADGDDSRKYRFRLFSHALKLQDWSSAQRIAESSDGNNAFLDRFAIEKYRRGDDAALVGFPRSELDFYIALDLADAISERGDYERLETFVRGIKALPSNEPTDVGAIVWRRIADEFRQDGDMDRAREFIDKSMEIGGTNYYTGYSVRVTSLAIHGGLDKQAEEYAELAVRYRGHHTRELLGRLITELVAAGHFDTARDMLKFYPTNEEKMSGKRYFARHLARHGRFDEAVRIARGIADSRISASARMYVAGEMHESGSTLLCHALLSEAEEQLLELKDRASEIALRRVVRMRAEWNDRERVMQIIDAARSPLEGAQLTVAALSGVGM